MSANNTFYKSLLFCSALSIAGCSDAGSYSIVQDLELYREFPNKPWTLQCNPGCTTMSYTDITTVFYDAHAIVAVQERADTNYIILIPGDYKCCWGRQGIEEFVYNKKILNSLVKGRIWMKQIPSSAATIEEL